METPVKSPTTPTFYVDAITTYAPESIRNAQARRTSKDWCHLWTDGTEDDLHAFAARIGMRREWFQKHRLLPHYDLVPSRRAHAIRLGAVEKPVAEWLREHPTPARAARTSPGPLMQSLGDMMPSISMTVMAELPSPQTEAATLQNLPRSVPGEWLDESPACAHHSPRRSARPATVRTNNAQATLDLFAIKPAPLASRLQPLLLFAARFVERHARRAENFAEGTLALEGREQHLAADLRERIESAVLEVMANTLSRCCPDNRDLACAAFYRSGRNERSQWEIVVTLWNNKEHAAPRRPVEASL